jgi:hypothetical protein
MQGSYNFKLVCFNGQLCLMFVECSFLFVLFFEYMYSVLIMATHPCDASDWKRVFSFILVIFSS